ncbi:hypothetical protein BC938DRAFT_470866 [Jimgerdemannia flammicorona]|uniref:Uncharacterized protein n=1 Tax=Jimgerdemannia flammicorona TaxID=994334 RepID=A0A433Q9E3_9FUNG|nr:hypothetical protein BC938DRAFT_470866 [Jimgerdemannia flammicorona]
MWAAIEIPDETDLPRELESGMFCSPEITFSVRPQNHGSVRQESEGRRKQRAFIITADSGSSDLYYYHVNTSQIAEAKEEQEPKSQSQNHEYASVQY